MIKKPETDNREYKFFELENGVRVVVVNDPEADTSAASMCVGVGSFNDPPQIQGLAHFLEHMLFISNSKYESDGENSFQKFCEQHGGAQNAFTSTETTQFYFEIAASNAFQEALDRFAQFFISPLFTESATDRELHAVDSEHQRNLQSDERREFRVISESICSPAHNFHKFATGDLSTLTCVPVTVLREELIKFWKRNYHPKVMTLSIVSKSSLDDLEQFVRTSFSKITSHLETNEEEQNLQSPKAKMSTTTTMTSLPFDANHGGKPCTRVSIVPVKDDKHIRLLWQMPEIVSSYKSKSYRQLAHLLGHESEGSVLALLKSKQWATSLAAGINRSWTIGTLFECTISLTDEGWKNRDECALIVYQYIAMMKKNVPQEWIQIELQKQTNAEFRFIPKARPSDHCLVLSDAMQLYPNEDVLSWSYQIETYDPQEISRLLSYLSPEHCVYIQMAKDINDKTSLKESFYQVRYGFEKISTDILSLWANPPLLEELHLPQPNPFLPTSEGLKIKSKQQSNSSKNSPKVPIEVMRTERVLCYHKQDNIFNVPKTVARFLLVNPTPISSTRNQVCTVILIDLIDDQLNKWTYLADVAGLRYTLKSTWRGILLKISGFSEKLDELACTILKELFNLRIPPEKFLVAKEGYIRRQLGWLKAQPTSHAGEELRNLLVQPHWLSKEKIEQCKTISLDEINHFAANLWSLGTKLIAHIQGNVTSEEACSTCKLIETLLPKAILPISHFPEMRTIQIPIGNEVRHSYEVNDENPNSAIYDFYQVGSVETPPGKITALLKLATFIMKEPCFTILRTQEQLGYGVWSFDRRVGDTMGIGILIQSATHSPDHVESRISEFFKTFLDSLKKMPGEEFNKFKESLSEKLLERDTTLSAEVTRFWPETRRGTLQWDRALILSNIVKEITKNEVEDFVDNSCIKTETRRKLSILLHSRKSPIPEGTKEIILGTGNATFKRLFPLLPSKQIFLF